MKIISSKQVRLMNRAIERGFKLISNDNFLLVLKKDRLILKIRA